MLESVGDCKERAQESGKHLDAGRYVRHGWYQITTQCRTSWLTSMAVLSGIQAHLVLGW